MKIYCSIEITSSLEWTEIIHQTADMVGTTFRETVEDNGEELEIPFKCDQPDHRRKDKEGNYESGSGGAQEIKAAL